MNKYNTWYTAITSKAKNRQLNGYSESHHIIPKSLGGTDILDNLVNLTAREHFICHWLLTKIYPSGESNWKMLNALRMMRAENSNQERYATKITARVYEKLKEHYSVMQSIKVSGENNPMYGDKFYRSEEGKISQSNAVLGEKNGAKSTGVRKKISDSKKGKKREAFSEEWRENLSKAHSGKNNPMHGKIHSEETRLKMSEKAKGRKQDPEVVKKKADAIRGLKREKKVCPHCQQSVAVNGYARWHGENCKMK
jgi:hypothetical protein